MNRCLIIAEAGVNHNGSAELAFQLVDAAVDAGADIVKFQTFKAKNLVTETAEQCEYQVTNIGKKESQYKMLKRLELDHELHFKLKDYCNLKGIEFLSTAFDSESLKFLVEDVGVKRLKLPSGELNNAPLVLEHAKTGLDIILSTGMATLSEIEACLGVVAYGLLGGNAIAPNVQNFNDAYFSEEGKNILRKKVQVLHCTTEYPAPLVDINLNAMSTMERAFKLPIGYSDHSEGIVVPIAAVSMGACTVEKHFTLDKNMDGPDHKASLEPAELKSMVEAIRNVEMIFGDGIKGPRPSEVLNRVNIRKSLVASKNIEKGEKFTRDNLCVKRPGGGIEPNEYWSYLGKTSLNSYDEGDLVS